MIKKITALLAALVLTAGGALNVTASVETDLISKLRNATNEEIVKTIYEDFDGDGEKDLFAFTGKIHFDGVDYPSIFNGSMWYVSETGLAMVSNSAERGGLGVVMDSDFGPAVLNQNGQKILTYNHMWGNGDVRTTIFAVINGKTSVMSYNGYLYSSGDSFMASHSAYDLIIGKDDLSKGSYFGMGRTFKDYWYYWDFNQMKLREYGAIEISREQFLEFNGAYDILNSVTSGKIYNILYRGNGIININIYKDSSMFDTNDAYEFSHITVRYNGDTVKKVSYDNTLYGEGLYLPAIDAKTAVYPRFTPPQRIKVLLNGNELGFDQPPVMINERVMVPLRVIFESMGYTVNWNSATRTATAVKGNDKITVVINNKLIKYTINGKSGVYECDVIPQIISERTLVPVRAVAESGGCFVDWRGEDKTVIIEK